MNIVAGNYNKADECFDFTGLFSIFFVSVASGKVRRKMKFWICQKELANSMAVSTDFCSGVWRFNFWPLGARMPSWRPPGSINGVHKLELPNLTHAPKPETSAI